jgi:Protein of unknown function (DUF3102)
MSKVKRRSITVIAHELQAAVKREATDVIAIGALLLEAREEIDHGDWLPWLATNFGSSESTANNYMNAARFAVEIHTALAMVGVLGLLTHLSPKHADGDLNLLFSDLILTGGMHRCTLTLSNKKPTEERFFDVRTVLPASELGDSRYA